MLRDDQGERALGAQPRVARVELWCSPRLVPGHTDVYRRADNTISQMLERADLVWIREDAERLRSLYLRRDQICLAASSFRGIRGRRPSSTFASESACSTPIHTCRSSRRLEA